MPKFDVIIIGAGLGGLECGLILAKHGKHVCVVEKDALIGGSLQTFRRKGQTFDTGFHYVGGLEKGQMLHTLFSYFGLMDLPWVKMDTDFFDEVIIDGKSYKFANGYDHFCETLSEAFPDQKENLREYTNLLREVGQNTINSFAPKDADVVYTQSLFAQSAYDYLCKTISNPLLRNVLSGTSLKMELNPALPLYTFAQINSSFIQSAYRLRGGGMQIAEALRKQIEALGGEVRRNAEVTDFVATEDGKIASVVINGSENIDADTFISDVHPATTMKLLHNSHLVRKIYSKRIEGLDNTFGIFTVNIALKPNMVKYLNRNIYAYRNEDIWKLHSTSENDASAILISFAPPTEGTEYAQNIDILTPMRWETVSQWYGTKIGKRGDDYEKLKLEMAKLCIAEASKYIDNLEEAIENIYCSTPLTYADYTATEHGSAYGIRKDYNKLMYTLLTPRTPVANLLLTGQSLNLHGIWGVSMTSIFTCAEILGMQTLVDDIKRHN